MPRRIEYSARLHGKAERVYAILNDRAYWDGLMVHLRQFTPVSTVESFEHDDTGMTVTMTQVIARETMPQVAQTVMQTDLVITRHAQLGPFAPGGRTLGQFSATIPAAPGSLEGGMVLYDAEPGVSVLEYTPEAKVTIPLVGGKLEELILGNLEALFSVERDYLNTRLADQP